MFFVRSVNVCAAWSRINCCGITCIDWGVSIRDSGVRVPDVITGFTLGEPVRYATWVSVEESVEEEEADSQEVAAVAEPQPAAVSKRIPSQQPYSYPSFPNEQEFERRRQAMEEAELARIAS